MAKMTTINLDDHFEKFVADQIVSAHYDSASARCWPKASKVVLQVTTTVIL